MTPQFSDRIEHVFLPFYDVLEPLGEGAVASVYKVRTRKDGSIRALKALKPEHAATRRGVERFEDEYRILSTLHHPSLPEVYDYGIAADGRRYMVMELVEGVPLDQYVVSNKSDLWLLLFQLNEALAFIHEHNLLHLDLKPDNVLVRRTRAFGDAEMPLLMLIDFGLSYRRESGGKVKMVGTPGYMAPEVIRGEEELSRAADYYSAGVIIYELVEGKLPFDGSMDEILRAHLTRRVTFAQRKVEYAELYPWIEKFTSKEPGERLAAFQEFRRLMAARQDESIAGLERAYALGYIDSLGLIGKEEAWEELGSWAARIRDGLAARAGRVEETAAGEAGSARPAETAPGVRSGGKDAAESTAGVFNASLTDIDEKIREDLLKTAAATQATSRVEPGPIKDTARVVNLSGPPTCGKSYLLDVLTHDLNLMGLRVVALGAGSDYLSLVDAHQAGSSRGEAASVDPGSVAIDRFVAGWDRLCDLGTHGGAVLRVDSIDSLSREEHEFLEYVNKRVGMALAEDDEPGVFVLAVGKRGDVKKRALALVSGDGGFESVEIAPPGRSDADSIAETFRGHLSGEGQQELFSVYLERNLGTGGTLYSALKQAVTDGNLTLQGGMWHFEAPRGEPVTGGDAAGVYYRGLYADLPKGAQTLLAWLVCHPVPIDTRELAEVSGSSADNIADGYEVLRPYRVIERIDTGRGSRIGVVNDQVREGFYSAMTQSSARRIHRAFIEHLRGRPADTIEYYEVAAYHNERAGGVRHALLMRVRALRVAKGSRDIFAMRRLCEAGLAYVRKLRSREWAPRRWHLERYFIKEWVEAEQMATNFGGLVRVVNDQLVRRKREIPLSLYYKYATALEKSGDFDGCRTIIDDGKKRVTNKTSETYYQLLLEEANLVFRVESDKDSCHILDQIDVDRLSPYHQARVYVIYVLNYRRIGSKDKYAEFKERAARLSTRCGFNEHLLRLNHEEGWRLLSKSNYSEAKTLLRSSIRLAQRHREYRALAMTCFLASAVYYEEGQYNKALHFLAKSIDAAKQMGLEEQVNEFRLRYAMIYQNLGYYGNALKYAQTVVNSTRSKTDLEQYFYANLLTFELLMCINSSRANTLKEMIENLIEQVREPYRIGLYYRLMSVYHYGRREYPEALEACENARRIYQRIGYEDDHARASVTLIRVLLAMNRIEDAFLMIKTKRKDIEGMQSANIHAEYAVVKLESCVGRGGNREEVMEAVGVCEELRPKVTDANVSLQLDIGLFRGWLVVGDKSRAFDCFQRYYEKIKMIVGNLTDPEYVEDLLKNPEFNAVLAEFKKERNKETGRSSQNRPGTP